MTTENSLLDHASIQQCEQLANGTDLHGKRAKALLLLNNGEINSAAAKKSGLTARQVSYLLGRFKKVGMALFITVSGQKIVAKKAVAKKAVPKKAVPKKAVPKKSVAKKSIKKAVVKKPAPVIDVEESVKSNDDQELTGGDSKAEDKAKKKKEKKSSKKDKAKKASKKTKNSKGKKDKKSKKDKKGKKKNKK
jgi:hypothetical protein